MSDGSYISHYPSPIGILKVKFTVNTIQRIDFLRNKNKNINGNGLFCKQKIRNTYNLIYDQLNEYFTGQRKDFDLPLSYEGTEFQKKVWCCIKEIPYGEVVTYGQIAEQIGKKNSSQAVGNACRENPILIMIPCHRVVKAGGRTGEYRGSNYRKQWLIQHESKYSREQNYQAGSGLP